MADVRAGRIRPNGTCSCGEVPRTGPTRRHRFAKVNVDEEPNLAAAFRVQAIPTLAVLRDGELVGTAPGLVQADRLVGVLDRVAEAPAADPAA